MLLSTLVWLPTLGAAALLLLDRRDPRRLRQVALAVSTVTFLVSLLLWIGFDRARPGMQFVEQRAWIPGAGIGYHLDSYFEIVDPNAEQGLQSPLLDYNGGKVETHNVASGLSLDLVYDDRDSPIYATTGYYINAGLRVYSTWLGSDSDWQSFQSELRSYNRIGVRGVFAVWASNWFTFGKPPYLALPAIGWDTYARSGRGYAQGRIRGENQLYLEGEYRVSLSRDGFWGAAAFVNILATTEPETERFGRVDPGYGVGLRIKLNKRSTTNITVDYAWGAEGSNGLFLGTGEAF